MGPTASAANNLVAANVVELPCELVASLALGYGRYFFKSMAANLVARNFAHLCHVCSL